MQVLQKHHCIFSSYCKGGCCIVVFVKKNVVQIIHLLANVKKTMLLILLFVQHIFWKYKVVDLHFKNTT